MLVPRYGYVMCHTEVIVFLQFDVDVVVHSVVTAKTSFVLFYIIAIILNRCVIRVIALQLQMS